MKRRRSSQQNDDKAGNDAVDEDADKAVRQLSGTSYFSPLDLEPFLFPSVGVAAPRQRKGRSSQDKCRGQAAGSAPFLLQELRREVLSIRSEIPSLASPSAAGDKHAEAILPSSTNDVFTAVSVDACRCTLCGAMLHFCSPEGNETEGDSRNAILRCLVSHMEKHASKARRGANVKQRSSVDDDDDDDSNNASRGKGAKKRHNVALTFLLTTTDNRSTETDDLEGAAGLPSLLRSDFFHSSLDRQALVHGQPNEVEQARQRAETVLRSSLLMPLASSAWLRAGNSSSDRLQLDSSKAID